MTGFRKLFLFAPLVFLVACLFAKLDPKSLTRIVSVCVFKDARDSFPDSLIDKKIAGVSEEYEDSVGIRFKVVGHRPSVGDMTTVSFAEHNIKEKDRCFLESDIRMLFTSRSGFDIRVVMGEKNIPIRIDTIPISGMADSRYGTIIFYGFANYHLVDYTASGQPLVLPILKHEIGHLFGARHEENDQSFMNSSSSSGNWSKETIEIIRKNKWNTWNSRLQQKAPE